MQRIYANQAFNSTERPYHITNGMNEVTVQKSGLSPYLRLRLPV